MRKKAATPTASHRSVSSGGGYLSMRVARLLEDRSGPVCEVAPATTVFDALRRMEEANAECLLVRKADGSLAGIVSERDCLRRCVLKGRDPRKTRVSAIMTREVVTATPGARISRCMNLMHRHHIRHLPIVRRGRPLAIVSMQDLVRFLVSEKDFIIKSYEDYISGG